MRSAARVGFASGIEFAGAVMWTIRWVAALIVCSMALTAVARDTTPEQNAVEYARQEYRAAAAEHAADVEQVQRTRKALEPLQQQLAQDQEKARRSELSRRQAKTRLERAQQALDRAWKQ